MPTEKQPSEAEMITDKEIICLYCRRVVLVGESYYRAGRHVRHKTCRRPAEKKQKIAKSGGVAGKLSSKDGRVVRETKTN